MIIVSEVRCSDCLDEFGEGDRYAVIKRHDGDAYSDEELALGANLYHVLVCANCAGWYRDAVEVPR